MLQLEYGSVAGAAAPKGSTVKAARPLDEIPIGQIVSRETIEHCLVTRRIELEYDPAAVSAATAGSTIQLALTVPD